MHIKLLSLGLLATVFFSSFLLLRSTEAELPVDEEAFAKFVQEFPALKLPHTQEFPRYETSKELYIMPSSWDRPKEGLLTGQNYRFLNDDIDMGYMRRGRPDDYYAEGLVAKNKNYTAVLYSVWPGHASKKERYYIASFDAKGRLINKALLAKHTAKEISDFRIKKNGLVEIERFEIEHNVQTETVSYSKARKSKLKIEKDGRIAALENAEKLIR